MTASALQLHVVVEGSFFISFFDCLLLEGLSKRTARGCRRFTWKRQLTQSNYSGPLPATHSRNATPLSRVMVLWFSHSNGIYLLSNAKRRTRTRTRAHAD